MYDACDIIKDLATVLVLKIGFERLNVEENRWRVVEDGEGAEICEFYNVGVLAQHGDCMFFIFDEALHDTVEVAGFVYQLPGMLDFVELVFVPFHRWA